MELTYRWMQRKDLSKIQDTRSIKHLLRDNKVVANVVEFDNKVLGFVVYKIFEDKIKILKVSAPEAEVFKFIIDKIKCKFSKTIEISVCEYNLNFQIFLKNLNFLATKIKKINSSNFYIFEYSN